MNTYFLPLIAKKELAVDTMAFWFSTAGTDFSFQAGQYINMSIIDPKEKDNRGNSRSMSIASSPGNKDSIMFSMRMRLSAFKNNLNNLALGEKVRILGPFGYFVLPKSAQTPLVFLAGGIGVTPFRSMIEWTVNNKFPYDIALFLSNPTIKDAAFYEDLAKWSQESSNFKFIPTFTRVNTPCNSCETGRINKEMILKYINNPKEPIFFIAGTHEMVLSMKEILQDLKVDPSKIITEHFGGY